VRGARKGRHDDLDASPRHPRPVLRPSTQNARIKAFRRRVRAMLDPRVHQAHVGLPVAKTLPRQDCRRGGLTNSPILQSHPSPRANR